MMEVNHHYTFREETSKKLYESMVEHVKHLPDHFEELYAQLDQKAKDSQPEQAKLALAVLAIQGFNAALNGAVASLLVPSVLAEAAEKQAAGILGPDEKQFDAALWDGIISKDGK